MKISYCILQTVTGQPMGLLRKIQQCRNMVSVLEFSNNLRYPLSSVLKYIFYSQLKIIFYQTFPLKISSDGQLRANIKVIS